MLVIDEATCRDLLDIKEAIPWLSESFRAISTGPTVGMRGDVDDPSRSARGLLLGSYIGALEGVCFKVVGNWRGRRAGIIVAFDTATGRPEAIVSAAYVTDFRTGAASAVATRQLARPDSQTLALLGTGRQSLAQLQSMLAVLPIERVSVWNRTASNAEGWISQVRQSLGHIAPDFHQCITPEEAVREADVVVTCTRSTEPVLFGEWLRPGTHVNAIGAGTAGQRELDVSVLQRAKVTAVDSRELALRTGDFVLPLAESAVRTEDVVELGELLLGKRPGRTDERQITLFKSVGHAANDLAVAQHLAAKARRLGRGVEVDL
jgi:alanine dehydrogenase